jgi:hypothetical protein
MAGRKKYKIGDRVFFECYDGTIGTAIIIGIKPETYINDDGKEVGYDWLETSDNSGVEDYNTLPLSDPRVKELQKQLAKQDNLAQDIRDWIINKCSTYPDYYNNEVIAAALGQVAKEYGYKED